MDKEMERGVSVLQEKESVGTVQIADDVVAMIAALAAMEVEGVSAMAGNITHDLLKRVGIKTLNKGVKVDVSDGKVKADISLIIHYGYNIPATCRQVQCKVKAAVENMTGLAVTDVNVRINGVELG